MINPIYFLLGSSIFILLSMGVALTILARGKKKKAHKKGEPHPHWTIPWTKQFVLALILAVPCTGIVYLLHIPSVGWQIYLLKWYSGLTLFWCFFTPEWVGKPPEGGH